MTMPMFPYLEMLLFFEVLIQAAFLTQLQQQVVHLGRAPAMHSSSDSMSSLYKPVCQEEIMHHTIAIS